MVLCKDVRATGVAGKLRVSKLNECIAVRREETSTMVLCS